MASTGSAKTSRISLVLGPEALGVISRELLGMQARMVMEKERGTLGERGNMLAMSASSQENWQWLSVDEGE